MGALFDPVPDPDSDPDLPRPRYWCRNRDRYRDRDRLLVPEFRSVRIADPLTMDLTVRDKSATDLFRLNFRSFFILRHQPEGKHTFHS